jgi:hypothetical protein
MNDSVTCTPTEISFHTAAGQAMSMPWQDIVQIHAYKLDVIHAQLVIIEFQHANGHCLEVRDDAEGWASMVDEVASKASMSPEAMTEMLHDLAVDGEAVLLFEQAA